MGITDKLLVGLKMMKALGVVDKDFPKPNVNAFLASEDTMNAIRLRIASIEKTIISPLGNNPDIFNTEDTCMEQHANNPKQQDITSSNNPELGNTDEAITNKAQTADIHKQTSITNLEHNTVTKDKISADTDSTRNKGIKKLKQS